MEHIKGIIFDYGGTLDSHGIHWSEIIWTGYQAERLDNAISKDVFREAYVYAERELARVRHILPNDNFLDLLRKKVDIETARLNETHSTSITATQAENIAQYCYRSARQCIDEARPVLQALSERYPMMLVSNFYGNIDEVVRDFNIRHFFKGIIESAVVGIRKPNPTLFRLGVDALEMEPCEVLVVGDSLRKDILPAESLGCHVLWLKGKGWTPDEDALTHPCTITRLQQVLDMLTT